MRTIILPGFSIKNKDWAEDMAKSLNLNHEIIVHNWRHWASGKSFSFKFEIEKILQQVGKDKFNFIAKSVGSRVALRFMGQVKGKLNKVILTGIASTGGDMEKLMQKALPDFPTDRLLVLQNTNDPYSSYSDVKKLIHSINPKVRVLEKPGSEHHYPYPEDFQKFLSSK